MIFFALRLWLFLAEIRRSEPVYINAFYHSYGIIVKGKHQIYEHHNGRHRIFAQESKIPEEIVNAHYKRNELVPYDNGYVENCQLAAYPQQLEFYLVKPWQDYGIIPEKHYKQRGSFFIGSDSSDTAQYAANAQLVLTSLATTIISAPA